ncbi:LLM class flavin-dependent oxidoreductase [Pseudoroseomonas cervicalis]|uniref:LLM class flavin-dependent oxidoreductase n=1 Tax=Teichococcus cervicalis TaxID=204525 RepID=UPI0027854A20|nr:LLM class flavin-dependent oxidoreductase [Pseudoroseomonas cervicalis]MDQ1080079.1 alkanesulfonate monooxygenase SsuD/methylene tetrahydromethanopterin reductase-like flavin-dependent oxidoreductase (luciferase family) [Pseudoroseomonas cervicalis]
MRIDLAGWSREATLGPHEEFCRLFEAADRLGYAGVWFNEFHFAPWPYPSILLLAAGLFARTGRLRIGTSILPLPLHHPLLLAEQVAQLDQQSGGRLDLGIGRGTEPESLAALGIDPAESQARLEEGFAILRGFWTGPRLSWRSALWRFDDVACHPAPAQRPHPPVYVAGSSAATLRFAAREGLPLLFSLEPPEGRQLATYAEALAATGGACRLRHSSLSRYVCIGRDTEDVERQVTRLLAALQRRRCDFAARRGADPDSLPPPDRARFLAEQAIAGTPEQCHAALLALEARSGIGALRCVFNGNGMLGPAETMAGMTLFAQEVLPALPGPAA